MSEEQTGSEAPIVEELLLGFVQELLQEQQDKSEKKES